MITAIHKALFVLALVTAVILFLAALNFIYEAFKETFHAYASKVSDRMRQRRLAKSKCCSECAYCAKKRQFYDVKYDYYCTAHNKDIMADSSCDFWEARQ